MGWRERLVELLGGDELVVDPATMIEAGVVELWEAEVVVQALLDAGVSSYSIEDRGGRFTGESLGARPFSQIFVPAGRLREAQQILVEAQRGFA